ncbi:MAG: hypothetical protein KKD29_00330 [Candidatus Omnitrophica bacterium]|nr:hypothetical protein [Candidatus Omnitrophota bacterium]MBU4488425.1 hypothetical protein [Candidatus Omnitrophota bacterium]MCG2704941.1 hypothetical protein [Candidatus Omnitrophota bacterium]
MAIRKRRQLKFGSMEKRRKRRAKLKAAGKNPDQYFYSGIYIAEKK